ncbi:hypothetical protein EBZ38_15775, partial [bacterium]|nr:hypothetical protein [bacterium]
HGCHEEGHVWHLCPKKPHPKARPAHLQRRSVGNRDRNSSRGDAAVGESCDSDCEVMIAEADAAAVRTKVDRQDPTAGTWIVDSGASFNFTPFESDFTGPILPPVTKEVRVGNGTVLPIRGQGSVRVTLPGGKQMLLTGVHLVPHMHTRLLSVGHLADKGARLVFEGSTCKVYKGDRLLFQVERSQNQGHGLPKVHLPVAHAGKKPETEAHLAAAISMELAHQRLAHAAPSTIVKVIKQGTVTGLQVKDLQEPVTCESCLQGKAQRLPFPKASNFKATFPLQLVSMDLWGPARVPTLGRKSLYILTLICHFSSMVWSLLLPNKESSVVQEALARWTTKVERQSGHKLKTLRSDNGLEFKGAVQEWVEDLGIERQHTAPYSPQQNGKVERWHKTLGEGIRTLLLSSGLPANLWGEAVQYLTWVRNRLVHNSLGAGRSPYELWHGVKPAMDMVRTWGTMCCSLLPEPARYGKLNPRGKMFVVLGVDDSAKAWRIMDPTTKEVQISRNLSFTESVPWKQWRENHPKVLLGVSCSEEILSIFPHGEIWLGHYSEQGSTGLPVSAIEGKGPVPEEGSTLGVGAGTGAGQGTRVVRFAEPLAQIPEETPAANTPSAPDSSTEVLADEEEDDDLNTLARSNHRVRAVQELYSMSVEEEEQGQPSMGENIITTQEAESIVLAWGLGAM